MYCMRKKSWCMQDCHKACQGYCVTLQKNNFTLSTVNTNVLLLVMQIKKVWIVTHLFGFSGVNILEFHIKAYSVFLLIYPHGFPILVVFCGWRVCLHHILGCMPHNGVALNHAFYVQNKSTMLYIQEPLMHMLHIL